jgi:hypothetical protein
MQKVSGRNGDMLVVSVLMQFFRFNTFSLISCISRLSYYPANRLNCGPASGDVPGEHTKRPLITVNKTVGF